MAAQTTMQHTSSALGIRGVLAILFGFAAVFWPGITLVTLVYLISAFLLLSGLITLVMGLVDSSRVKNSGASLILTLVVSILEIGVGVYLLRHVHVAFTTFILIVGFILIFRGLVEIFNGLFEGGSESALLRTATLLIGVVAILAGVIILFQPAASGVAFVWILGLYALITGPLMIAAAVDLNKQ
jgi:uncharacterized membrane protein HdeD (DUF308 family)